MAITRRKDEAPDDSSVTIGVVDGRRHWHSECLSAEPTDDELRMMTDERLKTLAYADPVRRDGVRVERYRAGGRAEAERHGKSAFEEYVAPCRAALHLEYREAKRTFEAKTSINRG